MKPRALSPGHEIPDLGLLVRALVLSERFGFFLLLAPTPRAADIALELIKTKVSEQRAAPVRLLRHDPYAAPHSARQPLSLEVIERDVLHPLFHPSPDDAAHGVIHIVDASRSVRADDAAWEQCFHRLNRARNGLPQTLHGELILCIPHRLEDLLRRAAPDLWSIRVSVFEVPSLAGAVSNDRSRRRIKPVVSDLFVDQEMEHAERLQAEEAVRGNPGGLTVQEAVADVIARAARNHLTRARLFGEETEPGKSERREALEDYEALLTARRKAVEVAQGKRESERATAEIRTLWELSDSLSEMGEALHESGSPGRALACYTEAREHREEVIRRERIKAEQAFEEVKPQGRDVTLKDYLRPLRIRYRTLATELLRIGDVLRDMGDLEGAHQAYWESHTKLEKILELDPGEALVIDPERQPAEWFRDLTLALERLGDLYFDRGEMDLALQFHERELSVTRSVLNLDSRRIEWLRDLSVSLDRVGDTLFARGDMERALAYYEEGLLVSRGLSARGPNWPPWQHDLSIALMNVGSVHEARGDLERALLHYQEAVELRREVVERRKRPGWEEDLRRARERVAAVEEQMKARHTTKSQPTRDSATPASSRSTLRDRIQRAFSRRKGSAAG